MTASQDQKSAPSQFREALSSLRRARFQPELSLSSIDAPTHLAPYGVGLGADVVDPSNEERQLALGRFMLLYDPRFPETWGGDFRVVSYIRASIEPDVAAEQMLASVAWDWLIEALERKGASHKRAGGTATRAFSQGFGILAEDNERIEIELRASWTPKGPDMQQHLEAWADMVCTYAGLPPLPTDVARFPGRGR
ncbi:DUF3000 family protein [Kocuria koreensis]|uniref:DUF3000 family protein n=1 Tax=Rothia koreensis TaxID=592378 RepID=A0A7K1LHP1_9MICC|nr:DUF3000 domain-containing protein [Rothia koreensis]MUN54704.1 DUF3000 family protein [Rothia koreensis]